MAHDPNPGRGPLRSLGKKEAGLVKVRVGKGGWAAAPTNPRAGTHPHSQASSSPARLLSGPAPWPAPQGSSSGNSHHHAPGSWPRGKVGRSQRS